MHLKGRVVGWLCARLQTRPPWSAEPGASCCLNPEPCALTMPAALDSTGRSHGRAC
jgi:hypothetical protein